jgi:adenylate cyclase
VSEEVCNTAGIAPDALTRIEVSIRGRDEPMTVRTAADPTVLSSMLDPQAGPLTAETQIHKPGIDPETDGRHVHF